MKSAVALNSGLRLLSRLASASGLTLPSLIIRPTRSPSFARLSAGIKAGRSPTLAAPDAAGLGIHVIDDRFGYRVRVVADVVFVMIAAFADVIGYDGAAVFQVNRVSRGRGK